jgi:hypothetical protein
LTNAVKNLIKGHQKSKEHEIAESTYNAHLRIIELILEARDFKREYYTIDYGEWGDVTANENEDDTDDEGTNLSVICLAIKKNVAKLVEFFLDKGRIENEMEIEVKYAIKSENKQIVSMFMKYPPFNDVDGKYKFPNDWGLLPYAAYLSTVAIVKILLDSGADINAKANLLDLDDIDFEDIDEELSIGSALHWASRRGHTKIVKLLLDRPGCDYNAKSENDVEKNEYGETALHLSAKKGHTEILQLLLNKPGCDYIAKNEYGETAFHLAVEKGHTETV